MLYCNDIQRELIFRTLDRAQAYELVKNFCEQVTGEPLTTDEELREATLKLFRSASEVVNEEAVRKELENVNRLLDELMVSWDMERKHLVHDLTGDRRKNESLVHVLSLVAKNTEESLKDIVAILRGISNLSITEGKQPENRNLEKVHTCLTCSASFTSKRKDSKYCSSRCKQIAYRERKESA